MATITFIGRVRIKQYAYPCNYSIDKYTVSFFQNHKWLNVKLQAQGILFYSKVQDEYRIALFSNTSIRKLPLTQNYIRTKTCTFYI